MEVNNVYNSVKKYYGEVLKKSTDLKACACSCLSSPHPMVKNIIEKIPDEIVSKFYGCGNPVPMGIEGLTLLDLGSGSGRDCYIASKLVGKDGFVYGIDMTDNQLEVAKNHIEEYTKNYLKYEKPNMKFCKGFLECIDKIEEIKPNSIDIVISNCVINLSPNKKSVLEGVFKVLKEGGEFCFSDVYCSRRLSEEVQKDEGECISGALYINDFIKIAKEVGFVEPRIVSKKEMKIKEKIFQKLLGNAKFYSITFRLFKLKDLEPNCEDYGQVAVYNGKMIGFEHGYDLDSGHFFETNKPELVCGNTADMLEKSWLKKYFSVIGNKKVHFGGFNCGKKISLKAEEVEEEEGDCCSGDCKN